MASKRAQSETHEDDGFVVDDEAGAKSANKSKRVKTGTSGNVTEEREGKSLVSAGMHRDEDGNEYWEISKLRRVQISSFKGKNMVSVREYYEKDGKQLPGKKGISLPMDQFAALLEVLPEIEAVLVGKGETIPRLKYNEIAENVEEGDGGGDDGGTMSASNVAAALNTFPQSSTSSYQQQRQLVFGTNRQTPGIAAVPSITLDANFRAGASRNMMIWGFVQAMDKMANGQV